MNPNQVKFNMLRLEVHLSSRFIMAAYIHSHVAVKHLKLVFLTSTSLFSRILEKHHPLSTSYKIYCRINMLHNI
ncbi:hypothetical protein RJT34_14821 [Clitoria ternatea]|uniref:Uncharacterized protein n=1 Tax=Clitoria ternatea TaxID=43366 RepID=A0AAN9PNC0_CLITE